MNLTTPFTLPFCAPPHAYTPSRCSCQRCKKDHQCPRPQLDGGDAHRAMLPDHARTNVQPVGAHDDSYIYQLSLVLATATVSFFIWYRRMNRYGNAVCVFFTLNRLSTRRHRAVCWISTARKNGSQKNTHIISYVVYSTPSQSYSQFAKLNLYFGKFQSLFW